MRRISFTFLPLLVLAAGIVVGARAAIAGTTLSLVAYSTPKDAYAKIIPAFQGTAAGKGVSFNQSYGASGDQARAVAAGLSADIVALSLEPDVSTLVKKGIVPSNWNQNKYHGIVTDSVVVFVVRDGNPKNIHTWVDLTKKGVQVITPNPFTSGGARWNVMAAYGAERAQGKTDKHLPEVPVVVEGAEALRGHRLPARVEVCRDERQVPLQAAEDPVHDQLQGPRPAWLEVGPVPLLRPQHRDHGEGDWPVARPSAFPPPAPSSDAPGALWLAESRSAI